MRYEIVERDFVTRTLKLLEHYDLYMYHQVAPDEQYEVTLLLNCLLGLVIMPFESLKRVQGNPKYPVICQGDDTKLPNLDPDWGLEHLVIHRFLLEGEEKSYDDATLREIVAMFRHSMAHTRFRDVSGDEVTWEFTLGVQTATHDPAESTITELDLCNQWRNTDFGATMPIHALRAFAMKLARTYLLEF